MVNYYDKIQNTIKGKKRKEKERRRKRGMCMYYLRCIWLLNKCLGLILLLFKFFCRKTSCFARSFINTSLNSIEIPTHRQELKMVTIPYFTALTTYFSYGILFVFGHIRDFFRRLLHTDHTTPPVMIKLNRYKIVLMFRSLNLYCTYIIDWVIAFLLNCGLRDMHHSAETLKISMHVDYIIEFRYCTIYYREKVRNVCEFLFIFSNAMKFLASNRNLGAFGGI